MSIKYRYDIRIADDLGISEHPEVVIKHYFPDALELQPESLGDCWFFTSVLPLGMAPDCFEVVKPEISVVEYNFDSIEVKISNATENRRKWDERFLEVAKLISSWSKDVSTKVGSIVVEPSRRVIRSTGYNGFARGVADDSRLENRELKYQLIVHAEENAILNAALSRVSVEGCSIYSTWPPCTRCARMILQSGIREVVFPEREVPDRWKQDFELGRQMLEEAGFGAGNYRSVRVA